jgi:hypothetical protein
MLVPLILLAVAEEEKQEVVTHKEDVVEVDHLVQAVAQALLSRWTDLDQHHQTQVAVVEALEVPLQINLVCEAVLLAQLERRH